MYMAQVSMRIGYAQYFSADPNTLGTPTHNNITARLTIGIGTESFLTKEPDTQEAIIK
jgi:hypothetical protein